MCYELIVNNQSGADQTVAVFQVSCLKLGNPVVWLSYRINNKGDHSFKWDPESWQLGWGNTPQPLDIGVVYTSKQDEDIQPIQAKGNNQIDISYKNSSFIVSDPYPNSNLESGKTQILTDQSFTVRDALNMSVALYMDHKAILAVQGQPNSQYQFDISTIYYLTVTDYTAGTMLPSFDSVMSRSVMSCPTEVHFNSGVTQLTYKLNDSLQFINENK